MNKYMINFLTIILMCIIGEHLYSQNETPVDNNSVTPFTNLADNTLNSLTGYNLLFHAGGIASTVLIIKSDTDYNVHNYFAEREDKYNIYSIPAVYAGYIAPLVLGFGLYINGNAGNDTETLAAGCAVLQASFIAWSYSSTLKVFTGRPGPDSGVYRESNDKSAEFDWGLMNNGIHYGWPSGHMAVSTAVITSMIYFYDDSITAKIAGAIIWSYMAFGVTAHEGNTMHWFSDAAAGSLFGYAIGATVGKSFRRRIDNKSNIPVRGEINFTPLITEDIRGLAVSLSF